MTNEAVKIQFRAPDNGGGCGWVVGYNLLRMLERVLHSIFDE